MDQESNSTVKLVPQPASQLPRRIQPWRHIIIPGITFLLGLVCGMIAILLFALSISGNGQVLTTPSPPGSSDIIVQVGPAYITHIVERDLRSSGLVNTQNVQVTLERGDQMTINGDERVLLGFTGHFTIVVQPLVDSCQLKMHVLHADIVGIRVTKFVANFESRTNQRLQNDSSNLPSGFEYCKTSVRTDPQGLYITYSAKPVQE